jgi:peptidoglycan-N-acetylglucosamine deacetylase
MPIRAFWALIASCVVLQAHAQSISFSFDDGFDPREQPAAADWNASMLHALADAKVKSVLYVVAKRAGTPEGMKLVQAWADAGHEIGNHTFSHPNLGSKKVTLAYFIDDVEKNEKLFSGFSTWTPRLRFPYLKEGDTAQKRDGLRLWMATHGYTPAEVSIDASDWYYSERFEKWCVTQPDRDLKPFRDAYLAHLWSRASYYDGLAKQVVGHSVSHVILLHTNAINAAFLPDVIAMFRAKGWPIVTPKQAYADPLYQMKPNTLSAGESILWALAKDKGVQGLRYPAEDAPYEEPILDKLGL